MGSIVRPMSPLSYKAVIEHCDIADEWLRDSFNQLMADNGQLSTADRAIHTIIQESKMQCLAQLRWLAEQRKGLLHNVN